MAIQRYFDLVLNAGSSIPPIINVNQYDKNEQWIFTLYTESGIKYTPSSGSIVGIKADGYIITNAGTVNSSGQVVITETEQMTAAAGKAIFELKLNDDSHGTANFIVLVEKSPVEGGIVSESQIPLIEQAIEASGTIIGKAEQAITAANNAQTSANQASSSANSSQTYMNQAKAYRDEAAQIVSPSVYSLFVDTEGYISLAYTGGEE